MHKFRTHKCDGLSICNINEMIKLSGWINRKRDHGGLIFVDLRDHFGVTQCIFNQERSFFHTIEHLRVESVITVLGKVMRREADTINTEMKTGEIEVLVEELIIENEAEVIPFTVADEDHCSEDLRLKYRYLDLRRFGMHNRLLTRSAVISTIRKDMESLGFVELQTPILTASSPEGARDYLVPSRRHIGKFYALPQAPQIFKQLFMVSGFDKYFQIAPCFRDEDARSDRAPGEFYQLDFEMSFVEQEDVLTVLEQVMFNVFSKFSQGMSVTKPPFPRLPYKDSMLLYGTDKPDLRNPLKISDVSEVFVNSEFSLFANLVAKGYFVRAIPAPQSSERPRSFYDKLNTWAKDDGQAGLGYIIFTVNGEAKGPIASKLDASRLAQLKALTGISNGDSLFFVCGRTALDISFCAAARNKIANEMNLIDTDSFNFCFIVDYPLYEIDEKTRKIGFSHNPFSMPQGGMEAFNKDPLDILAYQYDIVCNGTELSSGAIRNHRRDIMIKAFEIAGYPQEFLEYNFAGIFQAFGFGAPPHGGAAPGIDRIVMLLTQSKNIREVIAFPLNQHAEDLMMQAPSEVSKSHLQELGLKIDLNKLKKNHE